MEFFDKAKAVKLRNYRDKFLIVGEDKTVRLSKDGTLNGARWTVELVPDDNSLIRLKSYYGEYLTAFNNTCLLNSTGKEVAHGISTSKKDTIMDWKPLKVGSHQVKLQGGSDKFLRAKRNSVTHDHDPHRSTTQCWVWKVDQLEMLEPASITHQVSPATSTSSSRSRPPVRTDSRNSSFSSPSIPPAKAGPAVDSSSSFLPPPLRTDSQNSKLSSPSTPSVMNSPLAKSAVDMDNTAEGTTELRRSKRTMQQSKRLNDYA